MPGAPSILRKNFTKTVGLAQAPQLVELGFILDRTPGFSVETTPEERQLALTLRQAYLSPNELAAARRALVDYYKEGLGGVGVPLSVSSGSVRFQRTKVVVQTLKTILTVDLVSDVNKMLIKLARTGGDYELLMLGSSLRRSEHRFALDAGTSELRDLVNTLLSLNKPMSSIKDSEHARNLERARTALAKYILMHPYYSIVLLKYWPIGLQARVNESMGGIKENIRLAQMETAEFILVDQWLRQASVDALRELGHSINSLPVEMSGILGLLRLLQDDMTEIDTARAQRASEKLQAYFRNANREDRNAIRDGIALLMVHGYR